MQVKSYCYTEWTRDTCEHLVQNLGSLVQIDGEIDSDVSRRIQSHAGWSKMRAAKIHMLCWICSTTRRDRVRILDIHSKLGLAPTEN